MLSLLPLWGVEEGVDILAPPQAQSRGSEAPGTQGREQSMERDSGSSQRGPGFGAPGLHLGPPAGGKLAGRRATMRTTCSSTLAGQRRQCRTCLSSGHLDQTLLKK